VFEIAPERRRGLIEQEVLSFLVANYMADRS
jgi:hypothetical protein